MERSARESIAAIGLGSGSRWSVERHVMLRVEYVVSQVALTHAGQAEADVAGVLNDRLRGLGVNPPARQVQQYAGLISKLPPVTR